MAKTAIDRRFRPQPLEPMESQEVRLIYNLRTLSERDRVEICRRVEVLAMLSRDPIDAEAGD